MDQLCHRAFLAAALCGVTVTTGCSSSQTADAAAPAPTGSTPTGSMKVTIAPADGTTPSIVVSGPGYNKVLNRTTTLTALKLGQYTIITDSAVGPDSVVGTVTDTGTVTGSPATVAAGDTAKVTVTYSTKSRVGGMWVANNNDPALLELSAVQLQASGTRVPAETLATPLGGPAGLALDPSGNMWVSTFRVGTNFDSLVMYTPADRNAGGAPSPSRVIFSTAIGNAEDLTFDSQGNLWVADADSAIMEFSAAQLAAGGTQTPAVLIRTTPAMKCPWAIAFDTAGNAWVADNCGNHIVEYGASQLTSSGSPTPIDTIGTNGGSLKGTDGLAFDRSHNLWVSNDFQPTVVEFTPAQLAAGGAPAPNVIITLPNKADPFGLVFDNRGSLWITDSQDGLIYALTSGQLAATGAPTPAVKDTLPLSFFPQQPLFDPYATAIGVSTSRVHGTIGPMAERRPGMRANHVPGHGRHPPGGAAQ